MRRYRLARAGLADEGHPLALFDMERDAVQDTFETPAQFLKPELEVFYSGGSVRSLVYPQDFAQRIADQVEAENGNEESQPGH